MLVKATETYPNDKETRDEFIETVLRRARQTNEWGDKTPGDIEMLFAKSALDASKDNINTLQGRDNILAQAASLCTLHSSRTKTIPN